MTNETNSNTPRAFEYGIAAGKDLREGVKRHANGEARAIYALCLSIWDGDDYLAIIPGKDGEVGESHSFTLEDMRTDPINAQGKVDGTLKSARWAAVFSVLFGINPPADNDPGEKIAYAKTTNPIKGALERAHYITKRIASLPTEVEQLSAMEAVELCKGSGGRVFLAVPQFVVFDPTDKAHKLSERQIADAQSVAMFQRELNNSNLPVGNNIRASLATLKKMSDVAANKRTARTAQQDNPQNSFNAALAFVLKQVTAMNKPDGLPDVTLRPTQRVDLFLLGQQIATMFADEKLSEEEHEQLNKRAAS